MAATILDAFLEERGLQVDVSSAGVAAFEGKAMDPTAVAVMQEIGLYPGPHRSRPVSRELLEEADLVLAMTPRHVSKLRREFTSPPEIYTLPSYAAGEPEYEGIADPYGGPIMGYRATVRQLLGYLEPLADRFASHST